MAGWPFPLPRLRPGGRSRRPWRKKPETGAREAWVRMNLGSDVADSRCLETNSMTYNRKQDCSSKDFFNFRSPMQDLDTSTCPSQLVVLRVYHLQRPEPPLVKRHPILSIGLHHTLQKGLSPIIWTRHQHVHEVDLRVYLLQIPEPSLAKRQMSLPS